MKNFWKPQILEMAESDIFCVKSGADHDAAIPILATTTICRLFSLSLPENSAPKCAQNNCD